jgi:hypothetical protein
MARPASFGCIQVLQRPFVKSDKNILPLFFIFMFTLISTVENFFFEEDFFL